jgi:exosortase
MSISKEQTLPTPSVTVPLRYAPNAPSSSASSGWMKLLLVQLAILAILLAWHYWHVLDRLVWLWRTKGDWSHGFIIPLFSLYYLYLRRDRIPLALAGSSRLSRWAGAMLLTAAFVLYVRSTFVQQEYPKAISLVLTVFGVALMVAGWPMTRWAWFAIAFLLFALPVPDRLYEQLTMPLREVAARISAAILSVLPGMLAEPQGTLVEYIYKGRSGTLDVERACSGMRLLVTMSALGVAMAFLNERPLWQRMIVILACVPIAIFCNIVRVTTTGFLFVFGREDLASGAPHMLLGLGMLLVAFALYSAMNYVLGHLFVDAAAPAPQTSEAVEVSS